MTRRVDETGNWRFAWESSVVAEAGGYCRQRHILGAEDEGAGPLAEVLEEDVVIEFDGVEVLEVLEVPAGSFDDCLAAGNLSSEEVTNESRSGGNR